jgi:leucyl-tRNA synthetase
MGHSQSLAYEPFPEFDEALAAEKSVVMPVQVNGKRRFQLEVAGDADEEDW